MSLDKQTGNWEVSKTPQRDTLLRPHPATLHRTAEPGPGEAPPAAGGSGEWEWALKGLLRPPPQQLALVSLHGMSTTTHFTRSPSAWSTAGSPTLHLPTGAGPSPRRVTPHEPLPRSQRRRTRFVATLERRKKFS